MTGSDEADYQHCVFRNDPLRLMTRSTLPPALEMKDDDPFMAEYLYKLQNDVCSPVPVFEAAAAVFTTAWRQAYERRVFFLIKARRMGIGPPNCRPGNMICVLAGARMLMILREPVSESTEASDENSMGFQEPRHFQLKGAAYGHGLINGEDVDRDEEGPRWYLIDLV